MGSPSSLLSLAGVCRGAGRGGGRIESLLVGVSLEVGEGQLVAVVGSRSQGKTTLLQLAAGLVTPEDGTVRFRGTDLASLSDRGDTRRPPRSWRGRFSCLPIIPPCAESLRMRSAGERPASTW